MSAALLTSTALPAPGTLPVQHHMLAPGTPPPQQHVLAQLGAMTVPDMNTHIIEDARDARLGAEQQSVLAHVQATPSMCLRDALLAAYVLNGGLVMCCQGATLAVHLSAGPFPAFTEAAPASLPVAVAADEPAPASLPVAPAVAADEPMPASLPVAADEPAPTPLPVEPVPALAGDLLSFEAELDALADACDHL